MDINTLRGLSTLLLLFAFVGLVFWVYSGKRKKTYDEAAKLPFADEEAHSRSLEAAQDKNPADKSETREA